MSMRWQDLLFAHWPIPAASLRPVVPDGLEIDTFDGTAWVGIVPLRMSQVRGRCLPPLPRVSAFPELNVRTYVVRHGRPGVWFFSLDAAQPLAVRAARRLWGLNYLHAKMACRSESDGRVRYSSHRSDRTAPPARLECSYRAVGTAFHAEPASFEDFVTTRWSLYATDPGGRLRRADVDHPRFALHRAEWQVEECDMTRLLEVELPDEPPHLLAADPVTVRAWLPQRD